MAHHYDTYREELAKAYPGFGYALWEPDPGEQDSPVAVGDVGFIREGRFHRLFNALLPEDHPSHESYGVPAGHKPLLPSTVNHISRGALAPNTLYSYGVTIVSGGFGVLAATKVGSAEVSFSCTKKHGAVLSFPVTAKREDTVSQDHFRKWIIGHIDSWFAFTQFHGLGVEMEDIILVTGSHRTRSWTNIAFSEVQTGAQLSLKVDVADALGANIQWGISNVRIQGTVHNQGPSGMNLPENQSLFIRGYRVKRYFFGMIRPKAAAEPKPDPPRSDSEPEKEVVSISGATEFRDPLHVLLEYIAKRAPDCELALVHDDDLERILGVGNGTPLESLGPDVVMDHLEKSKLEIGVMSESDSLSSNDHGSRTDAHVRVAMLSGQLKRSSRPTFALPLSVPRVLGESPKYLGETYERVLKEIGEAERPQASRLLQCLIVAIRPLTVEELAEVLALDFDGAQKGIPELRKDRRWDDPEQALLSMCSSLIDIIDDHFSNTRIIVLKHSTVNESLTSDRLSIRKGGVPHSYISLGSAHTTFAQICLGILLQSGESVNNERFESRSPLAKYAAQHWIDHARFEDVALHVEDGMRRLFDSAKPYFTAWLQLHDIDDGWDLFRDHSITQPRASPLYYASLCGFRDLAAHLISEHPKHVNTRGGLNHSPLVAALHKRHFHVAELLYKYGAAVDVRGSERQTPLHAASLEGLADVVQWLLTHGADANSAQDGFPEPTPLHRAAANGRLEITRMLLDHGADADGASKTDHTPLHQASKSGHLEIVRLLLERGADVNAKDFSHSTPLHLASSIGATDTVRLLILRGADVNAVDNSHSTPLHLASSGGKAETAQTLIDHGSKVNARDGNSSTSLHLASSAGSAQIMRLLIDHGTHVNARDGNFSTPLHLASVTGSAEIVRLLIIDYGAYVDARDGSHSTSLHLASSAGLAKIVRLLLDHGTDVNARDGNMSTALHLATSARSADIVQLLLDHGTDVNARDGNYSTSLHLATSTRSAEIVQLLIKHGADVHAKDSKDQTPHDLALSEGRPDYVAIE